MRTHIGVGHARSASWPTTAAVGGDGCIFVAAETCCTTPRPVAAPTVRAMTNEATPGSPGTRRYRPPGVSLSAAVYQRLQQVCFDEQRDRQGAARPIGTIVMDAVDRHRARLAHAWEPVVERTEPGTESLFVRSHATAVPKRRRHSSPPRIVPLSGIDAVNARLLDDYARRWGAVTRAALVEQALRYEFGMD